MNIYIIYNPYKNNFEFSELEDCWLELEGFFILFELEISHDLQIERIRQFCKMLNQ